MRKVICAGVVILVCFSFSSCGDNKTTEKLIGAQVMILAYAISWVTGKRNWDWICPWEKKSFAPMITKFCLE